MTNELMRIGSVAAAAGVNIQTLRYYERRGLLPAPKRSTSGQREYPADTVGLIRFIKRSQELGFTLAEAEELLRLRERRGRNRGTVRQLATTKLADVDGKLRHLQRIRDALAILVDSCECRNGRLECPIIEALDEPPRREDRHAT